jgi:cell division septation protein DedD
MTQADGEKELVLGNRQLISLFFVVVALCGVFFAMGYLIGRNSTKGIVAGAVSGTDESAVNAAPAPAPAAPAPADAAPQAETPAAAENPGSAESQPAAIQTQPARDTPGQTVAPLAPAPPPPSPASIQTAGTQTASAVVIPEPGATYLQVAAQHRADANNLVKTLREQNLPAVVAASSKEDLFRVLVGPYHQTAQVAEAKDKLKALGFANAFVQKQ